MKTKQWIIRGMIIVGLALAILGYFQITGNVVKEETIKIGAIFPVTGPYSSDGTNAVNGIKLAVKNINNDGGISGKKIELIVEDDNSDDPKEVISAYHSLKSRGVNLFIGPMYSNAGLALAPITCNDKSILIAPAIGISGFTNNKCNYTFDVWPVDYENSKKFGYKKVALFTDNAEYSIDISKYFRNSFNGTITTDEIITPDLNDYRTEIAKITKESDVIVINTASGISAAYIIKQLYESGNKKPIFANFIAFNENSLTIAGKQAFENVYIYDPEFEDSEITKNFFEKYRKSYGTNPTIAFHTTGTYDAIKMIAEANDDVGYDGRRIHNYLLKNIKNWHGMNGIISFDEKGNTGTGFVLKQVKNGKLEIVS